MGGLKRPDTNNLYDTISQNVVVPVKKDVEDKEIAKPKKEQKKGTSSREKSFERLLNPVVKERKTEAIYLRVKPSVKKAFDELCTEKGISQADMFSYWVESILQK